jgi:hypothetical protein
MYDTILALINTNKADASNITPAEDREVDIALLDYIKSLLPLAKGVFTIGDVNGSDISKTITFPNVGTSNYYVLGSLKGRSANFDIDNDVFWIWGSPTTTSFKLYLREVASNVQILDFYWEIKQV